MALGQSTHVERHLDDRANLRFEFPQEGEKLPQVRICPFFENPTITENKTANLVKYDVLGRPGTLFGFTGSKSRTFKVSFYMTLPHMVEMATAHLSRLPKVPTRVELQEEFFIKNKAAKESGTIVSQWEKKRAEFAMLINGTTSDEQLLIGMRDSGLITGEISEVLHGSTRSGPMPLPESSPDYALALKSTKTGSVYDEGTVFKQTVEFMMFWVNLIRSSVLNNVNNPTLGPPIIRLTFGMLYDKIPTIAENYSVDIVEEAGYDLVSLLPNRIKLSLTLHELQRNPGESTTELRQEDTIFGWERNIDRIFLKESGGTDGDYSQQLWGGSIYDNS
tara:strand:- start:349 stop:1350 length:1002 start_codon:yes stop_codon:yes gene_type:complete